MLMNSKKSWKLKKTSQKVKNGVFQIFTVTKNWTKKYDLNVTKGCGMFLAEKTETQMSDGGTEAWGLGNQDQTSGQPSP